MLSARSRTERNRDNRGTIRGVRIAAAVLALIAVGCMSLAMVGMVTGRPGDRAGYLIRVAALVCFGLAVLLNVLAH